MVDALQGDPDDRAAKWTLGVDAELAREANRRVELTNFLDNIAVLRGAHHDGEVTASGSAELSEVIELSHSTCRTGSPRSARSR